jgi:hypothetical protein
MMRIVTMNLIVVLALAAFAATPPSPGELQAARSSCDLEAAITAQAHARSAHHEAASETTGLLLVEASLLVAELLRFDFEATDADDRDPRLALGRRIDAAAREGLGVCDQLPESSQQQRLRADLLATMIRSRMRAKRYEDDMKQAAARALELDPDNVRAMVSAAKPLVFADASHGGDPEAALVLLNRALDEDPQLVSALLVRSAAYLRLGDEERAQADLAAARGVLPDCPAERLQLAVSSGPL